MNFKSLVASFAVAAVLPSFANAITFDLTDPDSKTHTSGPYYAKELHYSSEGVNLDVSAVSFDKDGNIDNNEWVGLFGSYGLGIKSYRGDSHTIDNGYVYDFLVLEFDTEVTLDSVSLGYDGGDTDVTLAYFSKPRPISRW